MQVLVRDDDVAQVQQGSEPVEHEGSATSREPTEMESLQPVPSTSAQGSVVGVTGHEAPLSKLQIRSQRIEAQRADAVKVRAEIEAARIAQDEKTLRLRALRLAKEATDREAESREVRKSPKRRK